MKLKRHAFCHTFSIQYTPTFNNTDHLPRVTLTLTPTLPTFTPVPPSPQLPQAMMEKVPESWPTAPTHFTVNKYTYAFQEFVNTYGIPRYREANPALFTAATFPFLFGVMYGDIGHGGLLALAGLYLIATEANATRRCGV